MADALISPPVGGALWAAAGGGLAYCARRVRRSPRDGLVPLMGVLGAFVFAAQMITFAIPGTGSSGHLGGGLLLAILLGPEAAFLVMASVLAVQSLFFADGGLLALGCNLVNLGCFPACVAYPLIYRPLAGGRPGTPRAWLAALAAAVAGLQLGASGVVLETKASGIADLPWGAFALLLLSIHLAIGVAEGLATAAVLSFVARARPEVLPEMPAGVAPVRLRPVLAGLAAAALVAGGVLNWFASARPDGLEWALAKITGRGALAGPATAMQRRWAAVQQQTAVLPGYDFQAAGAASEPRSPGAAESAPWPAVNAGTSLAGVTGGLLTVALVLLVGFLLRRPWRQRAPGAG